MFYAPRLIGLALVVAGTTADVGHLIRSALIFDGLIAEEFN